MPKKEESLKYELSKANAKRLLYFAELESLYNLALRIDDPAVQNAFLASYKLLPERFEGFRKAMELENDLKFKLSSDHVVDYSLLTKAEMFRTWITEAHSRISSVHSDANTTNATNATVNHIRLPKISLPEFNGELAEWPFFWEKFTTIIHENTSLDDLSKLHYLLGALKGGAREVCAGFTPTAANYPILVNALKARYDNKRCLADLYLHQILDLKTLPAESVSGLNQVLTRFDTAYKSLSGLNLPDLLEFIMATLLLAKLDLQTRRAFETSHHSQIPIYQEVHKFVQRQVEALSQLPKTRTTPPKPNNPPPQATPFNPGWKSLGNQVNITRLGSETMEKKSPSRIRPCPICGHSHQLYNCKAFAALSVDDRRKQAQDGHWCFNCLSQSHMVKSCNSKGRCRMCNRSHHTLLHIEKSAGEIPTARSPSPTVEKPSCNFMTNCHTQSKDLGDENIPILPTALVYVQTPMGHQRARFLIDSGSQRHFISLACCQRFGLPFQPKKIPLQGMGNTSLHAVGVTNFAITWMCHKHRYEITALVTVNITHQLPPRPVRFQALPALQQLPLADPGFCKPGPIDGILGAQLFGKILSNGNLFDPTQSPQVIETTLGCLVLGDVSGTTVNPVFAAPPPSAFCVFDDQELTRLVNRFWELEEVPKRPKPTDDEKTCEDLFLKTTTRINNLTYCVHLPFREFPPILGESRSTAERRFFALERKFNKNSDFRAQYGAVIRDYLAQGHLSRLPPAADNADSGYYIPHFAVVKESTTTPLRIVFDASAKTSNGRSLNEVLHTGPKLQKDIGQILLSFRLGPIALVADIKQMYRNIAVWEPHRIFQKIFWRESPEEPLQTYQLNCVVFGLTSAPYLALRTVQQLTIDEKDRLPIASQLADRHMYVDDLVVSLGSVSEALEAYQQLMDLFKAGGFRLTKWISNSPEILKHIPKNESLSLPINFANSSELIETVKVLGIQWDPQGDFFFFSFRPVTPLFTKRGVLSIIARIWDPVGFLAPVVLSAKILLKDLWAGGLGWDDELPLELRKRWELFLEELPGLSEIRIPRYFGMDVRTPVVLVGFAEASEKGYGAVVYLRCKDQLHLPPQLICSKSRVAPQKSMSLPRLELCAAVLLVNLMRYCGEVLQPYFPKLERVACTDSTVVLSWIAKTNKKRDAFVAHRLTAIELVLRPDEWYHVSGKDNIADVVSRGLSPMQLRKHPFWFHGPTWLQREPSTWPIQADLPARSRDPSPLDPMVSMVRAAPPNEGIELFLRRFSSWKRLLRVTVYLLRFGKRLPLKAEIQPSDLEVAERTLIRQVQQEHFSKEFDLLQSRGVCSPLLRALSPFLDGSVLRVGGRLSRSTLEYDTKHPLLLPKGSWLSTLIIRNCHESNFHTGPSLVLAIVRQRFWILSARALVRKCVQQCNFCFKQRPAPTFPPMADLPPARVQEAKPFLHTGVDYAGPFQISISRRRGVQSQKAYVCLFICLATKAIHLELASSLSTEVFLACFQRFVARRGPVGHLYSDRGTNFIGAKAALDTLHTFVQEDSFLNPLRDYLNDRHVEWHFNPPHAPHFGGIWEGNIKAVKTHLAKAIGSQILSYEEFLTVLVQVEALLNSRPLFALSCDPAEPIALTPAHFLTLTPLQSLPLSVEEAPRSLRSRKALLDSIIKSFWRRWHIEYLTTLHPRKKWATPSDALKVGTVVVVKCGSVPPLRWPLGVVEHVHPGADGIIRVATVRVGKSVFQRPVVKLCPLPSQG